MLILAWAFFFIYCNKYDKIYVMFRVKNPDKVTTHLKV